MLATQLHGPAGLGQRVAERGPGDQGQHQPRDAHRPRRVDERAERARPDVVARAAGGVGGGGIHGPEICRWRRPVAISDGGYHVRSSGGSACPRSGAAGGGAMRTIELPVGRGVRGRQPAARRRRRRGRAGARQPAAAAGRAVAPRAGAGRGHDPPGRVGHRRGAGPARRVAAGRRGRGRPRRAARRGHRRASRSPACGPSSPPSPGGPPRSRSSSRAPSRWAWRCTRSACPRTGRSRSPGGRSTPGCARCCAAARASAPAATPVLFLDEPGLTAALEPGFPLGRRRHARPRVAGAGRHRGRRPRRACTAAVGPTGRWCWPPGRRSCRCPSTPGRPSTPARSPTSSTGAGGWPGARCRPTGPSARRPRSCGGAWWPSGTPWSSPGATRGGWCTRP